jgi:hypothetical protein
MVGQETCAKVRRALRRGKSPLDVARLFRLSLFTIALIASAPDWNEFTERPDERLRRVSYR